MARAASAGAPPNLTAAVPTKPPDQTAASRAPAKHPRYSSAQIDEMTVRQLKRALEERGESYDLTWAERPDERKLLQQHATSLRTMCTDASSGPDATGTTHSHSHSHLGPDADSVDEFARFRDLRAISEPDAGSLDSWGGHPRRFREPLRSTPAPAVPPSAPGQRVAGSPQGPSRGDPISDRGDPISDHGDPISERGDPISDRGDPISGRGDPISGQRPGSPQGQPEPSGQPSRPASTAVPPCAPAYREGLQVQVQDQPPDGTFEKIKRRLEQESMARLRGRPTHFINPAHEPEERSQSVWAHVLRPEILSAASAAKRKALRQPRLRAVVASSSEGRVGALHAPRRDGSAADAMSDSMGKAVFEAASDGKEAELTRLIGLGGNVNWHNPDAAEAIEVNAKNIHDVTALHLAAYWGYLAIAKRLLEGGADPTLRDISGRTAIDIARQEGKSEVVALLSEPRYAARMHTDCPAMPSGCAE
ncbi:ankyrin repeat protein mbp3 16, partial [Chrysochromulina tobinii]